MPDKPLCSFWSDVLCALQLFHRCDFMDFFRIRELCTLAFLLIFIRVLLWPPESGWKVYHCYIFSPFVDNSSHCGSLESQSLSNDFVIPSQIASVLESLQNVASCAAFWDLLAYFTMPNRLYLSDGLVVVKLSTNVNLILNVNEIVI